MKKRHLYVSLLLLLVTSWSGYAQEPTLSYDAYFESEKTKIEKSEKEKLKEEVKGINDRLSHGQLTEVEANLLKEELAKTTALNIDNRLAILKNQIALMERGGKRPTAIDTLGQVSKLEIGFGAEDNEGNIQFGIRFSPKEKERKVVYDRRTYSDFVLAFGLNNAIIEGQSLNDTPYRVGGSRFFEMGLQWRTRVFKNTNWLRFNYGLSFQFNGLKPKDNNYFVSQGIQTNLQEFAVELDKAKLRMDNLVVPFHFEFGPSKYFESEDKIRYSINNQFRLGVGGYAGLNLGTRQKLKYQVDGERIKDKIKRDYNTNDFVYGLSAYAGWDDTTLYIKYDLNPIFNNAVVAQRNISLGLRFDLD